MLKKITSFKKEVFIVAVSFLLLTAVITLIELYGINALNSMQKSTNNIYNHPLKVSNASLVVKLNIIKIHRDMKDVVLSKSKDKIKNILITIEKNEKEIYKNFDIIKVDILGIEGYKLYEEARLHYDKWKPIRNEVISLVENNKYEEAIKITRNKGAKHVTSLELKADKLNQYARQKATQFKNNANETFLEKRKTLYIIIIAVIIFSLAMTFYISRRFYLYTNLINENNKKLKKSNILLNESHKIARMGSFENYILENRIIWNDEIYNILGIDKNSFSLTYKNIIKLIHPQDRQRVKKCYKDSLNNKKSYIVEYRIQKDTENLIYIIESANIKINKKGEVSKIVGIIQDITEKKISENEKLEQLQINDRLFNNLEISIWNEDFSVVYSELNKLKNSGVTNLEKYLKDNPEFVYYLAKSVKVIGVNKNTLDMFKANSEKEFIMSILHTFGDNAIDIFKKELLAIWNEEDYFRHEADFLTLDKKELKGIVSFAIPKTKSEFKSIPVTILDITILKEKDKLILLQSRHAAMGEMISMIAHQWRQPISIISMLANNQILDIELDDMNKENFRNYSEEVLNQTQHLSETIDDFRNFFKSSFENTQTNTKELIEDVLKLVKSSFYNHSIIIEVDENKFELNTKKRELVQVIINILNNAKDALLQNKIKNPKINIYTSQDEDFIKIKISDNATGIKEEILSKIFEPYFTTKNERNGTGLGLYMSKTIVEKHLLGKIEVQNNKTVGASFTIAIPKVPKTN